MGQAFSWRRSLGVIAIYFLCFSPHFPSLGLAQSKVEPKQPLFSVLFTRIKPEMLPEWEGLQGEINAALKKGGVLRREVWQTAVFGNLNQFLSITPLNKFAELDGPSPFERALGKEGWIHLLSRINRCVLENHRYAQRVRADLGLHKRMPERTKMAVFAFIHVAPGRGADFETFLKNDFLPAIKKAETENYWVYDTVLGGDPNTWATVSPMKNWAEFDAGSPIVRALGPEVFPKAAGIVTSIERSVFRFRDDLSYTSESSPRQSAAISK